MPVSTTHAIGSLDQKFALSKRWRCKTKENKVHVALEFRDWNLEMLLRVMRKWVLWSIEWLWEFFVSWSECATFASHYTNSGALLTNYSTSGIARNTRQKRVLECPWGVQRGKKARQATVENIFIKTFFCAHFSLGIKPVFAQKITCTCTF